MGEDGGGQGGGGVADGGGRAEGSVGAELATTRVVWPAVA